MCIFVESNFRRRFRNSPSFNEWSLSGLVMWKFGPDLVVEAGLIRIRRSADRGWRKRGNKIQILFAAKSVATSDKISPNWRWLFIPFLQQKRKLRSSTRDAIPVVVCDLKLFSPKNGSGITCNYFAFLEKKSTIPIHAYTYSAYCILHSAVIL